MVQRAASTLAVLLLGACGSLSPTTPPSAASPSPAAGAWPQQVFAPYIDVTLATPTLTQLAAATGSRYFTLAFVVSGASPCQAAWGGQFPMSQGYMLADIGNLRAQGGDVIASFGGAAGTELAVACSSVASLQAQYQTVIDAYGITSVDFDVEGNTLNDGAASDRRNKAIAGLQAAARTAGRPLRVSFTLPVSPTGLDPVSLDLLTNAVGNGVSVGLVNIMTMDYYAGSLDMGQAATEAARNTVGQIKPVFATQTDSQLWAMIGITPMLGVNDDTSEVFSLSDANRVLEFSRQQGTGLIAFWDTWRDQGCPNGTPQPSDSCSGVPQAPNAFIGIFKTFTR